MPLLIVVVLSVLVGGAVYLGTIRTQGKPPATGFGETEPDETLEAIEPGAPAHGYAYLQVSTRGPALRDRLLGLIGLVLLVAISMAVLAFAIYEIGHLINRTIEAFLE